MIAPARWAAYRTLRAVHENGLDLGHALALMRAKLLDARDRALASEIAVGTLRWRGALDHVLAQAARRPVDRIDPPVLDVLRLSAYQLLYLSRVPPHAVIDDAVEMTRRARTGRASGFVNAVLRAVATRRNRPPLPARPRPEASREAQLEYLTITLSHPRWLVERWLDRYGFEATERWLQFNNRPAPFTVRANRLKMTRDELAQRLASEGIETTATRFAPDGLVVTRGRGRAIGILDRGWFVVQDEASQLLVLLAPPAPGARVLDACAAPGGKATALAVEMHNQGMLVAADRRVRRLAVLRETLERTGVTCARLLQLDLTRALPLRPVFDLVVADVPCSGLGTLRRDPDIRWRRRPDDLPRFGAAALEMLEHAAAVVAPGGRLLYATCSSEPEENDAVVAAFLHAHAGFVRENATGTLCQRGAALATLVDSAGYYRTVPPVHGLEAFFGAVCRRVASERD